MTPGSSPWQHHVMVGILVELESSETSQQAVALITSSVEKSLHSSIIKQLSLKEMYTYSGVLYTGHTARPMNKNTSGH